MVKSAFLACAAMLVASGPGQAQQTIADDLIVWASVCIGTTCEEDMDFGFSSLVLQHAAPSIRFVDTSATTTYPRADWSVGVSGGSFAITSEQAQVLGLSADGNTITLGAGSTAETGAVSVGSAGAERRVANVADGTADTDAATVGQLATAVAAASGTNQTALADAEQRLGAIDGTIAALQTDLGTIGSGLVALEREMGRVGAIASAFSALAVNPRGAGDHFLSVGYGHYGGETALALGTFHFLNENRIFVNTGMARALGAGGPTAFRAGVTLGF